DDLAKACLHLMCNYDERLFVNIGSGKEISIMELSKTIGKVVGYKGGIEHDISKPDGTFRKLMDSSRIRESGWSATIGLEEGIRSTYNEYLAIIGSAVS
ncbi:MAG: GDP-L-fucose synthase, partial [Bacteroidota bacterium]